MQIRTCGITSQALKDRASKDILPRTPSRAGCCRSAPGAAQAQLAAGAGLEEVGEFLGLSAAEVLDTASFYEEYWLKPKGEHMIAVCRSIACEFCDSGKITDTVRRKLGIEIGETTDDGKFTLVELECLGACGGAPAALFDETLHGSSRPSKSRRSSTTRGGKIKPTRTGTITTEQRPWRSVTTVTSRWR